MKFTKLNEKGELVDFYTGLPVDDSSVDINASGKVVSSVSMMDSSLKLPTAREAYILSLQGSPNFKGNGKQDVLLNYKESLKGLLKVAGNGLYAKPPSNGGVES